LSAVAFQLHHYESVLRSLMAALKDGSLKVSREKTELSHEQEQLHLDRGEERQEIKADHLAAKEAHEITLTLTARCFVSFIKIRL
jgi:hypothetical protein